MIPKVKICGVTNLIDAKNALNLGADYIGFIAIEDSLRYLPLKEIRAIADDLTEEERAKCVLLTDEESIDQIVADCSKLEFKITQPYGDHKLKDLRSLSLFEIGVFKPIGVNLQGDVEDLDSYRDLVDVIILDSRNGSKLGGTGKTFDWDIFKQAKTKTEIKLALAGGIGPENIEGAMREAEPYMIDLSSGLESQPGIKSLDKMKAFFENLKAVV